MIKLEIVNKKSYAYHFKDELENKYIISIEFFDIQENLKIGDYIYFSKELLDPSYDGYSTSYTFGDLANKYGKNNISINDIDVIKIIIDTKEIYLKRLYG